MNIARSSDPCQRTDSQQLSCNPQQKKKTFVRPTSPPLPSLTLFVASLFAPAFASACTTARCPFFAVACSGVRPFCGARPRRQQITPAPHPGPVRVRPFVFKPPLSRNPTAPGPGGLFGLRGGGGHRRYIGDSMRSSIARGAYLLQKMWIAGRGNLTSSHFWSVSGVSLGAERCIGVDMPAETTKVGQN